MLIELRCIIVNELERNYEHNPYYLFAPLSNNERQVLKANNQYISETIEDCIGNLRIPSVLGGE